MISFSDGEMSIQASSQLARRGNSLDAPSRAPGRPSWRNIEGIHANDPPALLVDVEHDLRGLGRRLVEHGDDDLHHEIHGRIMIVMNDNPVQLRLLETRLLLYAGIFLQDAGRVAGTGHGVVLLFDNITAPGVRFNVSRQSWHP